jgi:hypothetical protein
MHEDLWSRRWDPYRQVWTLSSDFSRWPRAEPTGIHLDVLHRRLREWYYGDGGILMSTRARRQYTYVQQGLAAIVGVTPDPTPVGPDDYEDMGEIFSRFRSALTSDLESRRKRSIVWSLFDLREDRRDRRELAWRLTHVRGRHHGAGSGGRQSPYAELAGYKWEQYSERYDLIWKLMIRITVVAVVTSAISLAVSDSLERRVGWWVNALPTASILLIVGGAVLLLLKFREFDRIDVVYRRAQDPISTAPSRLHPAGRSDLSSTPISACCSWPEPR